MKYRPEVDGLRALAVIPVILFHAGFTPFSGGYVGVDIFFVISGYLITTILIEDIENNKFSIVGFYERRARRILPALLFVMLCCIPFAWMWMDALAFKRFSNSLVAVSLFVSNVQFWRESGYFAANSDEKPLLHTWSLAVEEQYYILFPVFLFFAWRFGKNNVFWMIVVFAAFSLALSEWGWRFKPTANFYLAPTRAWELLAGSIAAFVVNRRGIQKNEHLSLLGLAAICFSIFFFDERTPIPSLLTLIPILGVFLLLLYADGETLAARFLGTKVLVGVGLISYSAYLVHQPVFAFARIRSADEPSQSLMLLLGISSFGLAFLSWKFVEQPFRDKQQVSRSSIFRLSGAALLAAIFIGYVGNVNGGFSVLENRVVQRKESPSVSMDFWIIGDSHAEHLLPGLEGSTSGRVVNLTSSGCIPFRNVDRYDNRVRRGECAEKMNDNLDKVISEDPNAIVVLSSMGPVYLDGTTFNGKDKGRVAGLGVELITNPGLADRWQVYELGMRETLNELAALKNATVVFSIDVPELGIDGGCRRSRKEIVTPWFVISDFLPEKYNMPLDRCHVDRSEYNKRTARYKKMVYDVVGDYPDVILFDPTNIFCDQEMCNGYSDHYGALYKDADHLSASGSAYFASQFVRFLSETR